MEVLFVVAVILAFVAFRQWLAYKRRELMHRERLAAIEKGIEIPQEAPAAEVVRDPRRHSLERRYLFHGVLWMSLGLAFFFSLAVIANSQEVRSSPEPIPVQMAFLGLIPMSVGFTHLVLYFVERRIARRAAPDARS